MTRPTEVPEPCTEEAREQDCTCRCEPTYYPSPGRMVTDVPEPVIDPHCPLHGRYDPEGRAP